MPKEISMNYQAQYSDLYCEEDHVIRLAPEKIHKAIQTVMLTIPCVRDGNCDVSEVVTNCRANNRNKRSLEQTGFDMSITTKPGNGKFKFKKKVTVAIVL